MSIFQPNFEFPATGSPHRDAKFPAKFDHLGQGLPENPAFSNPETQTDFLVGFWVLGSEF